MNDELTKILTILDEVIIERNHEMIRDGLPFNPTCKITVLGQISLLINNKLPATIHIAATADLDAIMNGDHWIKKRLESLVNNAGLYLEDDAHLIWIPPESTFTEYFRGRYVSCDVIDPLYCLLSKAIKAKEKNKLLIQQALIEFGDELESLIKKHHGHLDYFYE